MREHKEDVPVLFQHFMEKVSVESGSTAPKLSGVFTQALHQYHWPGNIRELRNFAENCFLMNAGEELTLDHLPKRMSKVATSKTPSNSTLEELEQAAIKGALALCSGNISKAANHLGIARSTFYKKIEKYQLPIS